MATDPMKYSFGPDNGCLTPYCKTEDYKCPNWMESRDGDLDKCALPKWAVITECPYLRQMLISRMEDNKNGQ